MEQILSRLEKIAQRLENVEKQLGSGSGAAAAPAAASSGGSSPAEDDFNNLIQTHLVPFIQASEKLGDAALVEGAKKLKQAVEAELALIGVAASSKKPTDDSKFMNLFKPIMDFGAELGKLEKSNPRSNFVNHLKTMAEGVNVLGWVTITPTPMAYIKETTGSSQFWSNKILIQYKGKDTNQTDWVGHWDGFLKDLLPYVKQHHTTGLTWNPRGGDAPASLPGNAASASSSAPPAPAAAPPPPPPPSFDMPPPSNDSKAPDMGGVFAALNKGTDITKGLKHVDRSQMTHKNPELRATSVVPAAAAKKPTASATTTAKKPTVTKAPVGPVKQGNKWVVEHHVDNSSIVITVDSPKESIMVYSCKGSTIQIKGKVNNVFIDTCQKSAIVFEDAISSVDIVNSKSIQAQCTGFVPCFNVDKVDGCQLFLSEKCIELNTEVVTAKSSEMNVVIPDPEHQIIELPVPEQFKTRVVNKKLVTETMVHE